MRFRTRALLHVVSSCRGPAITTRYRPTGRRPTGQRPCIPASSMLEPRPGKRFECVWRNLPCPYSLPSRSFTYSVLASKSGSNQERARLNERAHQAGGAKPRDNAAAGFIKHPRRRDDPNRQVDRMNLGDVSVGCDFRRAVMTSASWKLLFL